MNWSNTTKKPMRGYESKITIYTSLIDTMEDVYMATCNMVNYRMPPKMAHEGKCPRDSSKRYDFH